MGLATVPTLKALNQSEIVGETAGEPFWLLLRMTGKCHIPQLDTGQPLAFNRLRPPLGSAFRDPAASGRR